MSTESPSNLLLGALACTALGAILGITSTKILNKKDDNDENRNHNQTVNNLNNSEPDSSKISLVRPLLNTFVYPQINTVGQNLDDFDSEQIERILRVKGKEIRMNAPVVLRQHFEQKGYAIIKNNLSHTNTKLNEFAELMRMNGLSILNGCENPDTCGCTFRHKRCRLFIARYDSYSDGGSEDSEKDDFSFYSSNCKGIMRIGAESLESSKIDSNEDEIEYEKEDGRDNLKKAEDNDDNDISAITDSLTHQINQSIDESLKIIKGLDEKDIRKSDENLPKLLNLFEQDFTASCVDIIEYLHYITGSESKNYTADIIFIADPFYEGHQHTQDNGYGKPNQNHEEDGHICNELCNQRKLDDKEMTCCMEWHQDIFCDPKGGCHPYDYVALFVLNGRDITPHQLMIGKAEHDNNTLDLDNKIEKSSFAQLIKKNDSNKDNKNSLTKSMSPDTPFPRSPVPTPTPPKSVREVCSIDLDKPRFSDIGYIINQQKELYHRHSEFSYESAQSRRNMLAIRFRYYDDK